MLKRGSIVVVLLLVAAMLVACPYSKNGATPPTAGENVLTSAEQIKNVAEDILYYARVYYNLGKITEAQFKSVKDAYDVLYVMQNQMIDARIAYLKMPNDATAEEKYRMAMTQVAIAQQKLMVLAIQLGLLKGDVPNVPIRQ